MVMEGEELPRTALAGSGQAGDDAQGHSVRGHGGNLPVPMILSILILALSSSLAKRCTACMGSSQVSGSM